MWSETVGLGTRPVLDQKKSVLVLLQGWCCVVKRGLITLVVIMNDFEGHSNLLYIVSLFCNWNITTAKINSVVHLLKS